MKTLNKSIFKQQEVLNLKNYLLGMIKLDIIQAIKSKKNPNEFKYRTAERTLSGGKKYKTPGQIFSEYYSKLPAEKQDKMYTIIENSEKDSEVSLVKAKIGSYDLKSSISVIDQVPKSKLKSALSISSGSMSSFTGGFSMPSAAGSSGSSSTSVTVTASTAKKIKEVDFILNKVECLDETNPEALGKDDIYMGGTAVDDEGETYKISLFEVGKFNDGDEKSYSGGKYLKKFYPDTDYTDDKLFLVTLYLIEKDSGGASDFLNEAYDATKDYIEELMMTAGVAALSAALASAAPSAGTSVVALVAAIIATLAVLVFAELIKLIASALSDDIFAPSDEHTTTAILESSTDSFDGSSELSDSMTFEDHSGKYRVKFTWKLVKS
jgi:hypothetical protein